MTDMERYLALSEEARVASSLWMELQCYLRDHCEALIDPDFLESPLRPLPAGSVLSYEPASLEEMKILFRCGNSSSYRLRVTYDSDLLCVRYTIDGEPFPHELLVTTRRGSNRFETYDRVPLSARELSLHMLMSLTYR
jgi:hypothetical protein